MWYKIKQIKIKYTFSAFVTVILNTMVDATGIH